MIRYAPKPLKATYFSISSTSRNYHSKTVALNSNNNKSKDETLKYFRNTGNHKDQLHHFQKINAVTIHRWQNISRSCQWKGPIHCAVAACSLSIIYILYYSDKLKDQEKLDKSNITLPTELKQKLDEALADGAIPDSYLSLEILRSVLPLFEEYGIPHESRHYTGLFISIALFYEYNKQFNKAAAIYKEVSEFYISHLDLYEENSQLYDIVNSEYDHLISFMLSVTTRYYLLASDNDKHDAEILLKFAMSKSLRRLSNLQPSLLSSTSGILFDLVKSLNSDITKTSFTLEYRAFSGDLVLPSSVMLATQTVPVFLSNLAFANQLYCESLLLNNQINEGIDILRFNPALSGSNPHDSLRNNIEYVFYHFITGYNLTRIKLGIENGTIQRSKLWMRSVNLVCYSNIDVYELQNAINISESMLNIILSSNFSSKLIAELCAEFLMKVLVYSNAYYAAQCYLEKDTAKAGVLLAMAKMHAEHLDNAGESIKAIEAIDQFLQNL